MMENQEVYGPYIKAMYPSGNVIDLLNPTADQIDWWDIAIALSRIWRFGGGTDEFYSVAEHSLWVMRRAVMGDAKLALLALLHDAHEAYTGDIITPMKRAAAVQNGHLGLEKIQTRLDRLINAKAGLPQVASQQCNEAIKEYDFLAFATECRDLRPFAPKLATIEPHPDTIVPAGIESADAVAHDFILALRSFGIDCPRWRPSVEQKAA